MTRLQLVPTSTARPADRAERDPQRPPRYRDLSRPRRQPPRLRLVPGTGRLYGAGDPAEAPLRRHNWLTLTVAAAAIAAAVLVSTADSTGSSALPAAGPTFMIAGAPAPASGSSRPFRIGAAQIGALEDRELSLPAR